MAEQHDAAMERPGEIRGDDGQRRDGRPANAPTEGIEPAMDHEDAPTVAPEERGATTPTEHAPGGDL
jgi:hypothetical protein